MEWVNTWRCGLPVAVLGLEQCGVWRRRKEEGGGGVVVVWRCFDKTCYVA